MFKGNKFALAYYNFFKRLRPYKWLITTMNIVLATQVWVRFEIAKMYK